MSERKEEGPNWGRLDEVTLARAWCDWNSRSRREYLDAILRLPPEERRKDRGASWGSIQDIFLHVLEDYIWWFELVPQGRPSGPDVELVGKNLNDEEMMRLTKRVERTVKDVMDSLTPEKLSKPLVVEGTSGDGKPYKMTTNFDDITWHMVEEEIQHRGEMNALFWQIGIDPPTRSWFSSEIAFAH